jgi:glucan phosphoethanolaminetransferase (alkaline phosphatase superfamily)
MYEEFLKQAREFDQSLWGNLFQFLGVVVFIVLWVFLSSAFTKGRLWLNLLALIATTCWTISFFLREKLIWGSLSAFIVLLGLGYTIFLEVQQRRKQKT